MTQQVAKRPGGALVFPPPPVMSKDLAYLVGTLVEPDGLAARRITPAMREEAVALLDDAAGRCKPPPPGMIAAWLVALGELGINRAPVGEAWGNMLNGVELVCGEIPAAVWSRETMRLGAGTWKWWPSPSEIDELVRPIGKRLLRELDALKKIATPPPGTVPVPAVEPDMPIAEFVKSIERKHGYQMRGFPARGEGTAPTPAPPPVRAVPARHLSGDALAALRAQNPTILASREAATKA